MKKHVSDDGEKILVFDLKNRPQGGSSWADQGPGIVIGISKKSLEAAALDGKYFAITNNGFHTELTLDANDIFTGSNTHVDGEVSEIDGHAIRNVPWEGWVTADENITEGYSEDSIVLVLPNSDVFFQISREGDNWIGIGGQIK